MFQLKRCSIGLAMFGLSLIYMTAVKADELVSLPKVKRIPVLKNPMIFPRIRTIYNLYRNPCQNFHAINWLDRPLFYDASLYHLSAEKREIENNIRQLNLVTSYGADGFSMLYHGPSHFYRFKKIIEAAEQNGNKIFISFLGHILRESPEKAADKFEPVLRRILASPAAARINGKVVIGSYRTDYISPEKLDKFLKIMRKRCGNKFYFVSTISALKGKKLKNYIFFSRAFEAGNGKLPKSEVEAAKEYLRSYLRVSDGLLMNGVNHVDTVNNYFHRKFYDQVICRIFSAVLTEPENQGKLFGLSASLGYINHIAGGHQFENGTRTLRESLSIAYAANPDFIIMPEWNELNENTCLEPSVNRSFSNKRIIRYFVSKNKTKLSPLLEDATDIPNLIVSLRAVIKGGDSFYVELLNVPDSNKTYKYKVICTLKDEHNRVIKKFPPIQFDSKELQEYRFTVSPRETATYKVIKPEFEITSPGYEKLKIIDGLPFTRFQSTWNRNYICLKQPLRDLAQLKQFKVDFTPKENGKASFRVSAESSKDKIRCVEILEDDTVVYTFDKSDSHALDKNDLLLHFYYSSIHQIKPFPIELSVTDGEILIFQDRLRLGDARENRWKTKPKITMNWKANRNRRGALLIVSNKQNAILNIKTPLFNENIKVSEIEKRGRIFKTYDSTVTLGVAAANRALDIPAPVDASHVKFSTTMTPLNFNSVYRVRLITMSGKIYSKGPYILPVSKSGEKIKLRVFSTANLTPIEIVQDKSDRLELFYSPASLNNCIIRGGRGRRWDATLGGGGEYGGAFSSSKSYPESATKTAPTLVRSDDVQCFEFDGIGNYIHFPAEAIPSSAAFTLEFEFKPFSLKNQILLSCHQEYEGMLEINIVNRHIQCEFRGRLKPGERPYYKSIKLSSPIYLKLNQWNKVKIVYDLKNIYLTTNSSKTVAAPWSRISWWLFNAASFGGWGSNSKRYFKGQLKYLKIKHYVDSIDKK